MAYKIAIVEDDKGFSETLKKYIIKYTREYDEELEVFHFRDGDEIVSDYEAKYDIIFLDIEMKRMDGMTTAQKIRNFDKDVIIIFITNMSHYAINGYAVDATNFLLKPISYFPFSQELKRALEKVKGHKQHYFLLPTAKGKARVSSSEILYVESMKHQLIFVTNDEEYTMYGTMKETERILKDSNFYRCNNCYLVNLAKVTGIEGDFVVVKGNIKLKISRPRKKDFIEVLTAYMGG